MYFGMQNYIWLLILRWLSIAFKHSYSLVFAIPMCLFFSTHKYKYTNGLPLAPPSIHTLTHSHTNIYIIYTHTLFSLQTDFLTLRNVISYISYILPKQIFIGIVLVVKLYVHFTFDIPPLKINQSFTVIDANISKKNQKQ